MKIGCLQTNPRLLQVRMNVKDALARLKEMRADIVVLPELFNTGYNFRRKADLARVAEPAHGSTVQALWSAAKAKNMTLAAGFAEKDGGKFYNSAVLVSPGKIHLYRKIHLFSREKKFFSPGNLGLRVFQVPGAAVGMMVCFDWFFPEACRTLALRGAQIVLHPANLVLPWGPNAMTVRALENGVFAATANRTGKEGGLTFIGRSQIVSPRGDVLRRASKGRPESVTAEVDPREASSKKLNRLNDLFKDRRPALYD